jgi:hypothetical protein
MVMRDSQSRSMPETETKEPQRIDATFRNGTMTALGVLLAFSLGFVIQWVSNPVPWQLVDIGALAPMVVGILLQLKALSDLLDYDSLLRANYRRACRFFMTGVLFTAAGVAVALMIDVIVLADGGP